VLIQAFLDKGIKIINTSQENYGGNTDFLNMMDDNRIKSKLKSKRSSIEHLVKDHKYGGYSIPAVYAGPGKNSRKHGFIKGKKDCKEAIISIKGKGFGGINIDLKTTLNVEDSPNSAGIVIDAIRCIKIALDKGLSGNIDSVSPFFFKHPLNKLEDSIAISNLENFLRINDEE
jgi:myo-inositol-1-phosphate synthase